MLATIKETEEKRSKEARMVELNSVSEVSFDRQVQDT